MYFNFNLNRYLICLKLNLHHNLFTHKNKEMSKLIINLQELMQTPVCMMTGEQLAYLISNLSLIAKQPKEDVEPHKAKHLVYGIKGIADVFGCSIPTANRIKKSGVIDDAISQVGRKIVVDADLALQLVLESKRGKEERHD